MYRFVLPTGTLDSSIGYFKRKIYLSQLELMCSSDGKGAAHEARGRGFKSQPKNILRDFGGLRYQLFYPESLVPLSGYRFKKPVPMALFLVVQEERIRWGLHVNSNFHSTLYIVINKR